MILNIPVTIFHPQPNSTEGNLLHGKKCMVIRFDFHQADGEHVALISVDGKLFKTIGADCLRFNPPTNADSQPAEEMSGPTGVAEDEASPS